MNRKSSNSGVCLGGKLGVVMLLASTRFRFVSILLDDETVVCAFCLASCSVT